MVLCRMGKPQRCGEPAAQGLAFREWGIPIAGAIEPPGTLEGGDVVWLNHRTMVVGRGYRTNDEGIAQLRAFAGPDIDVVVVPLPHWRGARRRVPSDVRREPGRFGPCCRVLAADAGAVSRATARSRLHARRGPGGGVRVDGRERACGCPAPGHHARRQSAHPRPSRARGRGGFRLFRDRNQRERRRRPDLPRRGRSHEDRRPARASDSAPVPLHQRSSSDGHQADQPDVVRESVWPPVRRDWLGRRSLHLAGDDDARQLHPAGGGSSRGRDSA